MADTGSNSKNSLMFNGKASTSEAVYTGIFREAKDSIIVIDRDLSAKTLELLSVAMPGVSVLIYSDNEGQYPLTRTGLKRFFSGRPDMRMLIGTIAGKCKGRYIIIDSGLPEEKVYLLSASLCAEEDNTCIIRMEDTQFMEGLLRELGTNAYLVLR